MAGFRIEGNTSGNVAEVTTGNELKVSLSNTPAQVGAVRLMSENDPGTVSGVPYLKSPETSPDFRLRVGLDSIWDDDNFNYTAQNFNKHKYTSNTLTMAWASGFLTTNSGNVTTTGAGCQLQTYRHFPIQGAGAIYFEQFVAFSIAAPSNFVFDIGGFLPAAASTSIPLDGIYFRYNSSGLFGVVNNNGVESPTSTFTLTITPHQVYRFTIVVSDTIVEFWVGDVLMGTKPKPTNFGSVAYAGSIPWAVRHHHTGTTSAVVNAKIANYSVSMADLDNVRLWASNKAGQGLSAIQSPSGATAGSTANNTNSAAPASATLSNTTAGYTTLGGKFQFAAVAGAETDYALFAYQVPAPTTSLTGRSLVVRGVWIDTFNTGVAVATTATLLEWTLGVGSTAVTLVTADAAATRSPKRLALGVQTFPVGAAVGAMANRIDVNLDAPVNAEPGTYLHIILRMPIGTATASQIIRGQIGINAYFE